MSIPFYEWYVYINYVLNVVSMHWNVADAPKIIPRLTSLIRSLYNTAFKLYSATFRSFSPRLGPFLISAPPLIYLFKQRRGPAIGRLLGWSASGAVISSFAPGPVNQTDCSKTTLRGAYWSFMAGALFGCRKIENSVQSNSARYAHANRNRPDSLWKSHSHVSDLTYK